MNRNSKLETVFQTHFGNSTIQNDYSQLINWSDFEMIESFLHFTEKLILYGEINLKEFLILIQKLSRIGDFFTSSFFNLVFCKNNKNGKLEKEIFEKNWYCLYKLDQNQFFKTIFLFCRNFKAVISLSNRLLFFDFLKSFNMNFGTYDYRRFCSKIHSELSTFFDMSVEFPDQAPVEALFSETIWQIFKVIRCDLFKINSEIAQIVGSKFIGSFFIDKNNSKNDENSIFSKLVFSSFANQKTKSKFKTSSFIFCNREKKNQSDFLITEDLKIIFKENQVDYENFQSSTLGLKIGHGQAKEMTANIMDTFIKGFEIEKALKKLVIAFFPLEMRFIKSFETDSLAFEYQILNFKRLKTQLNTLVLIIEKGEWTEELKTLLKEMDRILKKVYHLFRICENEVERTKLQKILVNPDFYQKLFEFLQIKLIFSFEKVLSKNESNERKSLNSFLKLIIKLLEKFCDKNALIIDFVDKYVFELLQLILNGIDVSKLLFFILCEFQNTSFEFFINKIYQLLLESIIVNFDKKVTNNADDAKIRDEKASLMKPSNTKTMNFNFKNDFSQKILSKTGSNLEKSSSFANKNNFEDKMKKINKNIEKQNTGLENNEKDEKEEIDQNKNDKTQNCDEENVYNSENWNAFTYVVKLLIMLRNKIPRLIKKFKNRVSKF